MSYEHVASDWQASLPLLPQPMSPGPCFHEQNPPNDFLPEWKENSNLPTVLEPDEILAGMSSSFFSSTETIDSERASKRLKGAISFKRKKSSSRFKGVLFVKSHNKWRAQLCLHGKKVCIGSFSTELEAAKARDQKVIELFGETNTRLLNFVPSVGTGDSTPVGHVCSCSCKRR